MGYPDLGDWHGTRPNEAQPDAIVIAELMAWSSIEHLTAGVLAFDPITVRPIVAEGDGSILLDGPIGGVAEVRIDGTVFPLWHLEDRNLMRLDANAWPLNDDLTLLPRSVGTFEVSYYQGWRPGRLLYWAAAELAREFYRAAAGDSKCRLPKGVTSVARQGVTFEIQKPLFTKGQTGIREIDIVLARYNPLGQVGRTLIATPETIARAPRRY